MTELLPTDEQGQKWFCANRWSYSPEQTEFEVVRSTDKCIWIKGKRRQARFSEWRSFFPTQAEAWDWLESKQREVVEQAQKELERETARLNQLRTNRSALKETL